MRVCLVIILSFTCLLLSCDRKSVDELPSDVLIGDINCNGVAYEIADAVMFSNFFVEGEAVFGNHRAASVAATDCNRDGIKLGVADFVCLVRVSVGDALPYTQPPPSVSAYCTNYSGLVNVDHWMGAVLLVCAGTNVNAVGIGDVSVQMGVVDGNTHIFVSGYNPDAETYHAFVGDFLEIRGNILWSEWGSANGARVEMSVRPLSFEVYQNFPNPFTSVTKITFDNPNNGPWKVTFYNSFGNLVAKYRGDHGTRIEIDWDATGLPSGIYFYKVEADGKSITKKATLLR